MSESVAASEMTADSGADIEAVVAETIEDDNKGDAAAAESGQAEDDEEEVMTVRSELTNDDDEVTPEKKKTPAKSSGKKRKMPKPPPPKKGRQPAVEGLTIPFRAVKRTMKIDTDIGTVQNEAAIVTTMAAELFVQSLAKQAHAISKSRGRNTIRYEDIAEARTKNRALAFLEPVLP